MAAVGLEKYIYFYKIIGDQAKESGLHNREEEQIADDEPQVLHRRECGRPAPAGQGGAQ